MRRPSLEFSMPLREVLHVEFADAELTKNLPPVPFKSRTPFLRRDEPRGRNNPRAWLKAARIVTAAIIKEGNDHRHHHKEAWHKLIGKRGPLQANVDSFV